MSNAELDSPVLCPYFLTLVTWQFRLLAVSSRLLTSQDAGTLQATQILLLNLTKSSPERSRSLCTSSVGLRIIQGLLVLAELAAEVDEVAVEKEESNKVEHSLGVL